MTSNKTINHFRNPFLWISFIVYCFITGYTMLHHELWGDEIHSWNIAKASKSFFDLLSNTRYEGHPPVWYIILWTISKFTHDPFAIQIVHLVIAWLIVFLILFYSPFPILMTILIPFGYFFLFEYSILSRNYAIGILIAFIICIIIHKNFKGKILLYYILLFFLANTHLLSLLLAASIHLYFLLLQKEKTSRQLFGHLAIGIIVFLPSVYFIFPPSDSSLSTNYWLSNWGTDHLSAIIQSPVRALAPIPNWTEYHFWDTQFMISKGHFFSLAMWCVLLISVGLILLCISLFRSDRKSLYFFLFNSFLIVGVSFVIPFTNSRHVGFIFIGLLAALWLYSSHKPLNKTQTKILIIFLSLQLIGGFMAISKDIKYPFSNGYRINELLKEIPNQKVVTDYWCLNNLSAFTDRVYYCIETQKEQSYLLWNSELGSTLKKNDRYSSGISAFMKKETIDTVYLLSTQRMENLQHLDEKLFYNYTVRLFDKKDGAIEKGGNIFLYEIRIK